MTFPGIFDNLPSSSVPTIGKAFPGSSSSSTIPSLTCAVTKIGSPTVTTAGQAVVPGNAIIGVDNGKNKKISLI